ncbi:hypothetical protein V2H45_02770 [Tumidithrix elongata RA019]|uniref:DUF4398 domain-containing protein n=1 Tax=Tumidithrix elongata BACA0141 TaxID=2716417 RepID=A0AAW9PVQ2_9CYAN|nr:hypothetical protein [Tumidithrix elongata RA019]
MNVKSIVASGISGLLLGMVAMPLASRAMPTETSTATEPTTVLVAAERHPNMVAARRKLEAAREDLRRAAHDYNGKRVEAIQLIDRAIQAINEGIAQDNH